ncbi:MAG: hypothetical protein M3Y58_10420 [Chloroflexota bacterium]|nr:hypothetical protein [Chloroflexota bacterium]
MTPNAADGASATPTIQSGGMTPQRLIVTVDSLQATLSLIAPTEGDARFIAASPAIADEPQRGIPGAIARLAAQCGFALARETISALVVSGPPVAVQVVGERDAADVAALAIAERFGVARIVAEPVTPPRNPARDRSWYRSVTDAWRDGRIEALLVIVPPGVLPLWAAQLLTALGEAPTDGRACMLALVSDTEIADIVPADAIVLPRDEHSASHLAGALNRFRTARLLHRNPPDVPILSRPEALAVALRIASSVGARPCVYLDVADGTTIVVADEHGVAVHHDPAIDYARGAVRLLQRSESSQITRWIPFTVTTSFLRTWALRRISGPMAMLTDEEDRAIATGFVHAALSMALENIALPIPDGAMWVLGPAIARLGSHAAALRMVANLMPTARVAIVTGDDDDLIPLIGALAIAHPTDASSLVTHDALVPIGSVVRASPPGRRARGMRSATLTNNDRTVTTDVAPDRLTPIPWRGAATLRLTDDGSPDDRISVHGGPGGILVDTRRRPLPAITPNASRPNVSGRLRPAAATNGASNP